jgi:hypothetical protein
MTQVVLEWVRLVDAELEYEVRGAGEPVELVHNGVLADWFRPLLGQPALAGYRLVPYHADVLIPEVFADHVLGFLRDQR